MMLPRLEWIVEQLERNRFKTYWGDRVEQTESIDKLG